jgi:hypothetical protein
MDYIINYLIIGYFISLGFYLIAWFSPVENEFTTKDVIGIIIFWPLPTYGFIKELIKQRNGRR